MRTILIKKELMDSYKKELQGFFRLRINLFCYIAVAAFTIELILGMTLFKNLLSAKDMPGIIGGILFSVILLATSGVSRSFRAQKARAFFFSAILILIAILAATAHPEVMMYMGIGLLLFAFFPSVLLLPWNWLEATAIGIFAICNFIWIYRLQGTFVNYEIFGINIILLMVATAICALVKRSEEVLRRKDFVLRKEVEEKNAIMLKELELAKNIHRSLIPHSMESERADVAVTYKPMFYMGGDYAKFHFADENRLVFVLADVTGHGVSAALLVNRLHTEVERLMRDDLLPGEFLKRLDDFINSEFSKVGVFLTAFCGLLDFSSKKLTYSNHGHPPQILLQSADNKIVRMTSQTFLMGVGLDAGDIYHSDISFDKGDRIILFTDGIIEARNKEGEFFDQERLEDFVKEHAALDAVSFNNKLVEEVESFQGGPQDDDIFLLTIQTK